MQNRFGERRSPESPRRASGWWGQALAGVCVLALTASCAALRDIEGEDGFELLRPFCLESKGKGRLTAGKGRGRYGFSYETLARDETTLVTVVDIPLYGEESLVVDLEKRRVSGSLVTSMDGGVVGGLFDVMLHFLIYRSGLEEHRASDCRAVGNGLFRCGSMGIERGRKEVAVSFEGGGSVSFAQPDGFYRRIRWSGSRGAVLELFPTECRRR